MSLVLQFELLFHLWLAALLSALIGIDRERQHQTAGLRTHILVGVGSCLFTMLSIYSFGGGDPGRVASQILPGLGFLGAGAILKEGRTIQGLTTAASMWTTAAVGMAIGTGAWFIAICATLTIWFILVVIQRMKPDNLRESPDERDGRNGA